MVEDALALEGIDALGLDELDRSYLRAIGTVYRGGPVGLALALEVDGSGSGALDPVPGVGRGRKACEVSAEGKERGDLVLVEVAGGWDARGLLGDCAAALGIARIPALGLAGGGP